MTVISCVLRMMGLMDRPITLHAVLYTLPVADLLPRLSGTKSSEFMYYTQSALPFRIPDVVHSDDETWRHSELQVMPAFQERSAFHIV